LTKNVSGPVAALLIFLALIAFAALFHNARLAPPETVEPPRPPEPNVEDQEIQMMRRGLKPLGVAAIMAPLAKDRGRGVRVGSVAMNSPAEKAGLQIGDLILEFRGMKTVHPGALVAALNQVKAGESAKMVIDRSGKTLTLTVIGITPLPPEEQPRP